VKILIEQCLARARQMLASQATGWPLANMIFLIRLVCLSVTTLGLTGKERNIG